MTGMQLTVETVPAAVFVEECATSRRVDLSFEIENHGADDLELVAVEQDVHDADGGLIQRRSVEAGVHIGPGERRSVRNPLPDFAPRIPLVALVYTFAFRTRTGALSHVAIPVSPIERGARIPVEPAVTRAGDQEPDVPPTPRRLARAWFETLYELDVYAAPARP